MNTFKKAALVTLGTIAMGVSIFSVATVGLVIIGFGALLTAIGFLAQPFLPKVTEEDGIIDVEPTSSTTA